MSWAKLACVWSWLPALFSRFGAFIFTRLRRGEKSFWKSENILSLTGLLDMSTSDYTSLSSGSRQRPLWVRKLSDPKCWEWHRVPLWAPTLGLCSAAGCVRSRWSKETFSGACSGAWAGPRALSGRLIMRSELSAAELITEREGWRQTWETRATLVSVQCPPVWVWPPPRGPSAMSTAGRAQSSPLGMWTPGKSIAWWSSSIVAR